MENKNVFNETVETLTKDAKSLTERYHRLLNQGDSKSAIDTLRLLKDTLSLIKDYDWQLMYSEYETDGRKQISIWEQNHCGDIRNHKIWDVGNQTIFFNQWIERFENAIKHKESCVLERGRGNYFRCSGKSYSLAKLCEKYDGCVVSKLKSGLCGIQNNCELFDFKVNTIILKEGILRQYQNKILFIDENSGLTDEQIDKLCKNHIVIGFR